MAADKKEGTSIFLSVSAEPAIFLYSLVIYLYNVIIPNLIQQKVCSPDSPPSTGFICNDTVLLAEATDIVTTRSTLRDALPAMILLFAGSWRDSTLLNKPIMYFAIFSEIIGISIQIFAYLNWTISPWKAVITEGVVNGLGGGSKLFFIGATCAITDNTKTENRTARLTLITAMVSSGACLASAISGYCLTLMGYMWFFILAIGLHIATFFLVVIFVKDKKPTEVKGDIYKVFKQLKFAFKKRPNIIIVWLMVISSCSLTVTAIAEGNVFVYYLENGFGFTVEEVGIYNSYRLMIGALSSALVPPILTKLFKWRDFKIGIVSSIVTIIACISMVCAKTKLQLEIFALFEFMRSLLYGLPKSIISKCVDADEIGVFISFCLIGECILPIGMFYLYDIIYSATSTTQPGAFYFASAATILVCVIFYSISGCTYTPLKVSEEETKQASNDLKEYEKKYEQPKKSSDHSVLTSV